MHFLLVSLFFFNALATTSPATVIKQSANFLSTLANADPDIVNKMIKMVGDLEISGLKEKQAVQDKATKALGVEAVRKQELEEARQNLARATNLFQTATETVHQLIADEETKRGVLVIKTRKKDVAQKSADEAKAALEEISNRVREEKVAFAKVLELLDSVVVPKNLLTIGRSLLSADAADPDAIAAVKAKVVALDKAADAEVEQAKYSDKAAKAALDAALGEYKTALDAHTAVAGALKEANADLALKTTARNNAATAKDVAESALDSASTIAREAVSFRDLEVQRIDVEEKTLAEAKKLLKTLL